MIIYISASLLAFTGGGAFLKRHLPQTPTAKTFNKLGLNVIIYNCTEIILLLIVRTTEARRLMGPCFPTGGLFLRGCLTLMLFAI